MHLHRALFRGVFLIVPGAIIVFWFFNAFHRRVDQIGLNPGRIQRTENLESDVRYIFAPRALVDFARTHQPPDDFEELVSELKSAGLGDSWYVVVAAVVQSNGTRARDVCCVHPSRMSHRFGGTRLVLEVLRNADEDRSDRVVDGTSIKLEIIPDEIASQDPAAVVHDLAEGAR